MTFFYTIIGNHKEHDLRERLLNFFSFANAIANFFGGISSLWLGGSLLYVLLHLGSSGLFLVIYLFSRFNRKFGYVYWPFIILMTLFVAFSTFSDGGLTGPSHLYLMPAIMISISLLRRLIEIVGVLVLNMVVMAVLWYLEINYEYMFSTPPDERMIQLTLNYVFVLFFVTLVTKVVMKSFDDEYEKSNGLLLQILPKAVAEELQQKGKFAPQYYKSISVLFLDFVGFTNISKKLTPGRLLGELEHYFIGMDQHLKEHNIEKIKTIGDSYMAAGGVPIANNSHAIDSVLFALKIKKFFHQYAQEKEAASEDVWQFRIGVHVGPAIAGVIGTHKFLYDIWGDTVNTASRMESSSAPNEINVSQSTYEKTKQFFQFEDRGKLVAKNKGHLQMYFVKGLLPEYSKDEGGLLPNAKFWEAYRIATETSRH